MPPNRCYSLLSRRRAMLTVAALAMPSLGACSTNPQQNRSLTGGGYSAGNSDLGLRTAYTVTFRYFDKSRTLRVVRTMTDAFPGYQSTELLESNSAISRYAYLSRAKAHALDRWLTQALLDEGLSQNAFSILVSGAVIRAEKL